MQLEIPLEAIARDPLLAASVQPLAERYEMSLRELQAVEGLSNLKDPGTVKRIKEAMEKVIRSLTDLHKVGYNIAFPGLPLAT